MPLVIAYARETAFSPRLERAAPEIRAVAGQVRRQIPRAPDELALALPALVEACRRIEVNVAWRFPGNWIARSGTRLARMFLAYATSMLMNPVGRISRSIR